MSTRPQHPEFLYGTAWKEEKTKELTLLALSKGFRGIDTANQRKHYHEIAVGEAIREAVKAGVVNREELFVQTKYTFQRGQDHRLPYDPAASITEQVRQSWQSSEEHLGRIDSYLLHGPSRREGLGPEDLEAWRAIAKLQEDGEVSYLGVSNVSAEQLEEFCRVGPAPNFVQNRCYARLGWDAQVRTVCSKWGVVYKAFSLLKANITELEDPRVARIAQKRAWTGPQLIFRFALEKGWLPLTGTTNPEHMVEDLAVLEKSLTVEEISAIESVGSNPESAKP